MFPLPCMLVCTIVSANRTRDRGCSVHPVFLAPSEFWRAKKMQTSGTSYREIANSHSVVIVREGGRSSIPETAVIPRRTGYPAFAGYDELIQARNDGIEPHAAGCATLSSLASR